MSRWLIGISGARPEILELCPTERVKFISIAWAMLIASGTAAVGLWVALVDLLGMSGIVAAPAAIAWGFVMLGVDRWMVTSQKSGSYAGSLQLMLQLMVSLLLAVIIATPLVLRVFQAEINAEISFLQEQRYSSYLQEVSRSAIGQQVSTLHAQVTQLDAIITRHGPGYQQAEHDLPFTEDQLQQATTELDELQRSFAATNAANNGLLVRLQALRLLESGNSTVSITVFLLVALCLMIEALPVMVRRLQVPGNYERILADAQRRELLAARRVLLVEGRASLAASSASEREYSGRDPLDAELERVWSSAIRQRHPGDGEDHHHDATEPELEPAESYEHARYEDAALAMLDDARTSDWPAPPNGIPLRWDDEDDASAT